MLKNLEGNQMKAKKIMIIGWEQKYTGWAEWAEENFEQWVSLSKFKEANNVIAFIKSL